MSDNVTKLRPEEEPKRTDWVSFTVRMATGDGAEIAAVTNYLPKPGENPNSLLDQIVDTLDRQRARSDVRNYDKEIEKHERALEKGERDIQALHVAQKEKIDAETKRRDEGQNLYDRTKGALTKEADERGREFDPKKPGNSVQLSPHVRVIADAEENIRKLREESETGEKNFRANMLMFSEQLTKLRTEREGRLKVI